MDEFPRVDVKEITPRDIEEAKYSYGAEKIIAARQRFAKKVLRLTWSWKKVPRGVDLGQGLEIIDTSSGRIIAGKDQTLDTQIFGGIDVGTYDRIKEFDWPNKDEHEMVLYLDHEIFS